LTVLLKASRTKQQDAESVSNTTEQTHDQLVATGEDQIPYLVDTRREEALYEADDIVAYLDDHYA